MVKSVETSAGTSSTRMNISNSASHQHVHVHVHVDAGQEQQDKTSDFTSSSSIGGDPPMEQQSIPSVHMPIQARVGEHGQVDLQRPIMDGYDEELARSETPLGGIHGIPSHSKSPPQEPQHFDNVALPPSSNSMASTTQQSVNNPVGRESFKPQTPQTPAKVGRSAAIARQNVSATPLTDQEKEEFETMHIDMGEVHSRSTPKHNNNTRPILPPPTAQLLTGPRRRQSQGSDFDNTDSSVDSLSVATTDNDNNNNTSSNKDALPIKMTLEDIQICQQLDDEYERALEEREVGYTARYNSVRQSAFFSVLFMLAYLLLGTAFFMRQADWTIADSLLFSIYTVTTVGYGSPRIPRTPGFQLYIIFYILIGIAALTIMVAQVYQCIALEASRAQHSRDKTEMARRGVDILTNSIISANDNSNAARGNQGSANEILSYHMDNMPGILDLYFRAYDRAKQFFRTNEIGRGISVLFPFVGLVALGALVVGPIEEWSPLEAVYFSVVSLTTVGFGDYVPTQPASVWFSIFWLPFSVGFMSLFLGNVAAFYIRLSDKNIARIERHMRRRLERSKKLALLERAEVLKRAYRGQNIDWSNSAAFPGPNSHGLPKEDASLGEFSSAAPASDEADQKTPDNNMLRPVRAGQPKGFDMIPTNESGSADVDDLSIVSVRSTNSGGLFGHSRPSDTGRMRRERILNNSISTTAASADHASGQNVARSQGRTMQVMRDVVRAVRRNVTASQKSGYDISALGRTEAELMSIRSNKPMASHSVLRRQLSVRKPSFALRVLVQERMAEIIATDIAGYQSAIDIKENTLSVTIDTLQDTADKWLIPRRARKAFRAVAFEALSFVGEHGLITRGADALYDLTPFEFHRLFNPLLASLGDAETMEAWLATTDTLADVDLRRDGSRPALLFIQPVPSGVGQRTANIQNR